MDATLEEIGNAELCDGGDRLMEDELAAILKKLRGGIGSRSVSGHEAASGIAESDGDSDREPAAKR